MSSANSQSNKGGQTCDGCQPDKHAAYCAERGVSMAKVIEPIVLAAMEQPYVERPVTRAAPALTPGTKLGTRNHRYAFGSHPRRCVECGVLCVYTKSLYRWSTDGGVTWSTERPACAADIIEPQQPAAPTCPICFRLGHTAALHDRPATIEVSQGLFELLDDLRIRARELEGRDVTHAELLEQGIERALEAL